MSGSASASSTPAGGPGRPAHRARPGLLLWLSALLAGAAALTVLAALPARQAAAAPVPAGAQAPPILLAQVPGDDNPPDDGDEGEVGDEGEGEGFPFEPDSTGAVFDTTGVLQGPLPKTGAAMDSLQAGPPPVAMPQPGVVPPLPGTVGAASEPAPPAPRRGILGLHPAFLVVGLIAVHVLVVKLFTN